MYDVDSSSDNIVQTLPTRLMQEELIGMPLPEAKGCPSSQYQFLAGWVPSSHPVSVDPACVVLHPRSMPVSPRQTNVRATEAQILFSF